LEHLSVHPLTPERWNDLEKLFGSRGACGGCWCMWWRLSRTEFERNKGEANRRALQTIVQSGAEPGLLAYSGREPVGWLCIGPRDGFDALGRSRVLAPVDDQPVWSAVCFFIAKAFRRQGVATALLKAAAEYARERGAKIIEGYPVPRKTEATPDAFAWTGTEPTFEKAGFKVVTRRGKADRGIFRKTL
jgi:GNAT superfamily N-acetyltransferase